MCDNVERAVFLHDLAMLLESEARACVSPGTVPNVFRDQVFEDLLEGSVDALREGQYEEMLEAWDSFAQMATDSKPKYACRLLFA